MPRIAGTDIPDRKKIYYALQYVHGVGAKFAMDILIDAARLTEPEFRSEDLIVRIENQEARARVYGDPLQIEQVLGNLL